MSRDLEPLPEPVPEEEGISLDALAQAYAQAMGVTAESREPPDAVREAELQRPAAPDAVWAESAQPPDHTAEPLEADDPCPLSPRSILEAMLFVGNQQGQALTARRAAELMRGVDADEIPGLVDELNARYAAEGCPYLIAGEGNGYRLTLRKAFHAVRNQFYGRIREARLSQTAIDVLSVVAYQQPVTAEQINRLRGKPSGHVLAQLVHRGLLRIEREAGKGRSAKYHTTDRFLSLFGLRSLEDLPKSEELER